MLDAPQPLDYATEVNVDPSAARYLQWLVAGIAMLFASEQIAAIGAFIYEGFFSSTPPYWAWDGIQVSRWIENGSRFALVALLLPGSLLLLRRTRLGARILFCAFLGCALFVTYQSVRIHLEWMSNGWNRFGAASMLRTHLSNLIQIATSGVIQLLLVTPPMARLMRLQ